MKLTHILCTLGLASSTAYASFEVGNLNPTPSAQQISSLENGTYTIQAEAVVTPVGFETEEGSLANNKKTIVRFYPNDTFNIIRRMRDRDGQMLLRLTTNFEEASDFYVWERDLPLPQIRKYNEAEDPESQTLADDEDAMDHTQLNVLPTMEARRGHWGRARRNPHGGGSYCARHPYSKGCCYAGVKLRLMAMHLVNHQLPGVAARTATAQLGRGWRSVGCGSRSRPVRGETCSYAGGAYGHVELYDPRCHGWFYGGSGGCRPFMQSPNRRCISCKAPAR